MMPIDFKSYPSADRKVTKKINPTKSASTEIRIRAKSNYNSSVETRRYSENSVMSPRGSSHFVKESTRSSPIVIKESKIDQYKMIRTIGKGEYTKVKLAKHVSTEKDVAIKIVHKADLNSNRVRKLAREVQIMKTLHHSNIVELYDVIETKKSHYLVMEYLSGGELFDHIICQEKLNETDARKIFRQIVSAVDFCHQKRIIHRDLKLENILLDSKMNIKLIDFGLSNQFIPENKLSTLCGTPVYLAPEIFLSKKYGVEADVWSLGIILYIMVTGCFPFDDSTIQQLRKEVLLCDYIIPDYVSADCKNLIKRIIVLKPADRATLKSIMEDKWFNDGYGNEKVEPYVESGYDVTVPKRTDP